MCYVISVSQITKWIVWIDSLRYDCHPNILQYLEGLVVFKIVTAMFQVGCLVIKSQGWYFERRPADISCIQRRKPWCIHQYLQEEGEDCLYLVTLPWIKWLWYIWEKSIPGATIYQNVNRKTFSCSVSRSFEPSRRACEKSVEKKGGSSGATRDYYRESYR